MARDYGILGVESNATDQEIKRLIASSRVSTTQMLIPA